MRIIDRQQWAAAAIAIAIAIAGCGVTSTPAATGHSYRPTMPAVCTKSGPLVFAVSGRQKSPPPVLTGTMHVAAVKAVDTGSAIGIVDVDGNPELVSASAFTDPTVGNGAALNSDRNGYVGQITTAITGVRAKYPHVNVLKALNVAGRAIRAACPHGGTIYMEDSGLQETGPLDFRQPGTLQASARDIVAFLTRKHDLPDLKGMAITLVGIGDTAPPQQPLSISQQKNLIAIWLTIVKAAGATSVLVDPAPRSGGAPAGVPPVAIVSLPKEAVWSPGDNAFTFPDSGPVGFEPNTAVFRDPSAASKALSRLANYLMAHPTARIELTGTTAHWGTLASDIGLSRRRAGAVKKVLIRLGAAPSQISTRGLGWKFSGYQNDQGPGGILLPGPAEHNRSVIVTRR
jgi:outer membrane protein OmpA-like peptidoglycan-associated protein